MLVVVVVELVVVFVLGSVERSVTVSVSVSVEDKMLSLGPLGRMRERQRQEKMQPERLFGQ